MHADIVILATPLTHRFHMNTPWRHYTEEPRAEACFEYGAYHLWAAAK